MADQLQRDTRVDQLRAARRVFTCTLILNAAVAVSKLVCGFWTNTLSMVADGFHSLLDASSNVVGIIGITISSRPPDSGHPYGHRKFEALAAIGISFLMFLASYEVLSECVRRFAEKGAASPAVGPLSYIIMLVTMIVNIGISRYEARQGELLRNSLLVADSKHTLSDVYATIGVIVSLVAIQLNFAIMDVIASLAIVIVIFRAGFGIIMTHLGSLVDATAIDPQKIEDLALSVPGVESCHKIRSRGTPDSIFVDLHIIVSCQLSVEQAHQISFLVEEKLRGAGTGITDVLVHVENDSLDFSPCHEDNLPK